MNTIFDLFGPRKQLGHVGVEIEVEGENLPRAPGGFWKAIPDNSLRGEGLEYITLRAITLEELKAALINLNERFVEINAKAHDAHRGSVHVHVNVQDKTFPQIFTTLYVWTMIEPLWMHLCGPTRESNLFCLPSSSGGDMVNYCRGLLTAIREMRYHALPVRGKYAALNTDPIAQHGSIEFRTFPSSIDPDKVNKWALWCKNLVDYGSEIDTNNLSDVFKNTLTNPMPMLKRVFDEETYNGMTIAGVYPFIERGCEAASDLVMLWAMHSKLVAVGKPVKPVKVGGLQQAQDAAWDDLLARIGDANLLRGDNPAVIPDDVARPLPRRRRIPLDNF